MALYGRYLMTNVQHLETSSGDIAYTVQKGLSQSMNLINDEPNSFIIPDVIKDASVYAETFALQCTYGSMHVR